MFEKLIYDLTCLPQIEAIALGGSRAGSRYDEKSDYDIYLYCTAPISEDIRRTLLTKYCSYIEIGNSFWELEDNCTLKNGIDMDILYRRLDEFCEGLSNVVEKFQAYNGYTTCMWHNLLTCNILYDRDGRLAEAKDRFSVPYPPLLRENIINRNLRLLKDNLPSYDRQIRKAAGRGDLVSVNHRVSAFLESYFDILFALNERMHPGEKRLVALCKESCSILPEHFEENLNNLFSHMFQDPQMLNNDLHHILEELTKIL